MVDMAYFLPVSDNGRRLFDHEVISCSGTRAAYPTTRIPPGFDSPIRQLYNSIVSPARQNIHGQRMK